MYYWPLQTLCIKIKLAVLHFFSKHFMQIKQVCAELKLHYNIIIIND